MRGANRVSEPVAEPFGRSARKNRGSSNGRFGGFDPFEVAINEGGNAVEAVVLVRTVEREAAAAY
jgi:hypothetical protein